MEIHHHRQLNLNFLLPTALLLLFSFTAIHVDSFYLPGFATANFKTNDSLHVKVNKLSSIKNRLPYPYYSLPFCRPERDELRGDGIENSPYLFGMRKNEQCSILCKITLDKNDAKDLKEKIEDEYRVNMILDNIPLIVPIERYDHEVSSKVYQQGFHVGFKGKFIGNKDESYFINNHLSFVVKIHMDSLTNLSRVVGFEVKPYSIRYVYDEWNGEKTQLTNCNPHIEQYTVDSNLPQDVESKKEIVFTYDVEFQMSGVTWPSGWDTYLLMNDDQIPWFSIMNSLLIVLFLCGIIAMIMLRTLYRDISTYNQHELEEVQEETGWKLVHGDVFRPPTNYSDMLCVHVGTGVQFLSIVLVTMIFVIFAFTFPSNSGWLITSMLLIWVFMGSFAGFSSARLYKKFKGSGWKKIALKTSLMSSGILFIIFFVLNDSPFTLTWIRFLRWFGISVPFVFIGSYIGFHKPALEDPVPTEEIPRPIPGQPWYLNSFFSVLISGILPFGAFYIELFFIIPSIGLVQYYYMSGFLFLVFVILIITCAETTIVLCYLKLCSEDYLWWWRSYLTSGSSAIYLFLCVTFYARTDIIDLESALVVFSNLLFASYVFFILTGAIGFCSCFWFTRLIYSSVKIDQQ